MKCVVLSATETAKEIKFLYQLWISIGIKVPLPIKIKVDNVGAIWLANNSGVSEGTKHVDTRVHFVRSFVMDEVVSIKFVKSAENTSHIMTKNQQSVYCKSVHPKLAYTIEYMGKENQKV